MGAEARGLKLFRKKISELSEDRLFNGASFVLLREEGIALDSWGSMGVNGTRNEQEMALVGGLWQASESLMGYSNLDSKDLMISLSSFGDRESGIYFTRLASKGESYILGLYYKAVVNPGKLKIELEKRKLQWDVEPINEQEKVEEKKETSTESLFSDITDDEIDQLFGM